jgi:hypothetical protein
MIGLIASAVGMASSLVGSMIQDKEIVTTSSTFTPDPMSVRDAGLYNTSVNLGEVKTEQTTTEQPGIKKGLLTMGSVLGAGGSLLGGFSTKGKPANSPVSDNSSGSDNFSGSDNIEQTA